MYLKSLRKCFALAWRSLFLRVCPIIFCFAFFGFSAWSQAATQNSASQRYANNADGFSLGGGTTARTLTLTGGDVTITGSGSETYTFPGNGTTLVGVDSTQTLTNKTWNGSTIGVPYGGTGATTLTGMLEGNGTSALTAVTGTANYATRWTSADAIGTGVLYDDGTNVGIGTTTPLGGLAVMSGNVGIGTWVPAQLLDVKGTAQMTAFSLPTNAGSGYVLTSNSVGVGTWMPASGGSSQWTTTNTNDAYLPNNGNVGIGTTLTTTSALTVMNGNVGIGTWVPSSALTIGGSGVILAPLGSATNPSYSFSGNTGTGFYDPANALNFTVGGSLVGSFGTGGYRLTDSGVFGWSSSPGVDSPDTGISRPSTNILAIGNGTANDYSGVLEVSNVGIGTSLTTTAALSVMNGNVGIGTWVPKGALQVNNAIIYSSEYSNGNSGTAATINWNNGNNQKITLTGNCTFTFTAPGGPTHLTLNLTQDGTGSRTVTWPAGVLWPGKVAPVLTTTASGVDIVNCYYNGTNYYCSAALNFG